MFPFWEKKVLDLVQLDKRWWRTGAWSHIQKTEDHLPRHQEHITQSEDAQYFFENSWNTYMISMKMRGVMAKLDRFLYPAKNFTSQLELLHSFYRS